MDQRGRWALGRVTRTHRSAGTVGQQEPQVSGDLGPWNRLAVTEGAGAGHRDSRVSGDWGWTSGQRGPCGSAGTVGAGVGHRDSRVSGDRGSAGTVGQRGPWALRRVSRTWAGQPLPAS